MYDQDRSGKSPSYPVLVSVGAGREGEAIDA